MSWSRQPSPIAGRPIRRLGKAYIWITWLSQLLGGKQCVWSAWFKSHYKYVKVQEEEARELAEWSAQHDALMRARRQELERLGYRVTSEGQNEFKLEGELAIIAGKPDLVARHAGKADSGAAPHTVIVDGKTGLQRHSDFFQVLIYLFVFNRPHFREALQLVGELSGEIQYKRGDIREDVPLGELTPAREQQIVALIKTIAGEDPPARVPSREECKRCNIGPLDCPERFKESSAGVAMAAEF